MSRKLYVAYNRPGIVLRSIVVLMDDSLLCKLKNHETFEAELSEGEHTVVLKLSNVPILKGTVTAGENDWALEYDETVASFRLYEKKPFYGNRL